MSQVSPPPPRRPPLALALAAATAAVAGLATLASRETPPPPRRTDAPAPARSPAPPPPDAPPSASGPALGEAPAVAVELDPVGPPGDLAAEIEAFVDLPGCVQKHKPADPLLAEGLEALGYERFTWDTCRSIEALKRRRPEPCEAMLSSALRRRCLASLAVFSAEPALCPLDEPAPGLPRHDIACLAAARRDLRTCAGLRGPARAACEGLLVHDATRCGTDERCARQIARWQRVLPVAPNVIPYRARLGVRVEGPADAPGPRDEALELPDEAAEGAWLIRKAGGRVRLALGEVSAARALALPPPAGGFWVEVPEGLLAAGGEAELAGPEAAVYLKPARGPLLERAPGQLARLRLEPLAAEPHGPLRLSLEIVVGPGEAPRRATFTVDTWLRDIVDKAPAPARP
ncbi:MAG TPA: hypothetical protein VFS43_41440 [Polyangiaceae bacterium]|nr:hypothetical protein [Polyangiaceae bacterium]